VLPPVLGSAVHLLQFDYDSGEQNHRSSFVSDGHRISYRVEKFALLKMASLERNRTGSRETIRLGAAIDLLSFFPSCVLPSLLQGNQGE
jgi:hypothetical protein